MPVEIKELLVKGILEGTEAPNSKPSSSSIKATGEGEGSLSYGQRKQIVDQCVQEVMDKIKKMTDF
jgi:hypothetical protein